MIRKTVLASIAVVALALGAAACGSDSEDSPASPTKSDSGDAAVGGGSSAIALAADPGGDLTFDKQALSAKAGRVTLAFTNDSPVPHNVEIETEGGDEAGVTETISASKTSKQFDLKPGNYEYYCTIDSHKGAGMEGKLIVK